MTQRPPTAPPGWPGASLRSCNYMGGAVRAGDPRPTCSGGRQSRIDMVGSDASRCTHEDPCPFSVRSQYGVHNDNVSIWPES